MPAITARWSRGVMIDGELETLGLEVVIGTTEADTGKVLIMAADLDRKLALAGDALVIERLDTRKPAAPARVQRPGTARAKAPDVVQVPPSAPDLVKEAPKDVRPAENVPGASQASEDPYLLG